MSRAYRIRVSESLHRHIHLEDGVQAGLDILDILPSDAMAQLLRNELARRGFEDRDGEMVRQEDDGTVVTVDPVAKTVTVRRETQADVALERTLEVAARRPDDDETRQRAGDRLRGQLESEAREQEGALRSELTHRFGVAWEPITRQIR